MPFIVVLIADLLSSSVSVPWWLYLLIFLAGGALVTYRRYS